MNSEIISRVIRGIVGLVIVIAGILNNSWIGFLGAFLLFGAITRTGGCGFGSPDCTINRDKENN